MVALRAEMDALPVKEPEGLPFASKALVVGARTITTVAVDFLASEPAK
jgi:metal-dependent amidase/aminoacylase/carboxypeptidase family protein